MQNDLESLVEQLFILRTLVLGKICFWGDARYLVGGICSKKMTGTLFGTVGVVYFDGRKNITFNQYLLQNKEIL